MKKGVACWLRGFPGGLYNKESVCNAGDPGLIPGLGRSPGEGNGSPVLGMATPVFLPGEFNGLRRLAGYRPWDFKESDPTKQLTHTVPCIR